MDVAKEIGFVAKSSSVKRIITNNSEVYGKANLKFPHDLLKIYFKAEYLVTEMNSGQISCRPNSRTYLSYFMSGLSEVLYIEISYFKLLCTKKVKFSGFRILHMLKPL